MTCIIALPDSGKVWMGSDSAVLSGWSIRQMAATKVFRNGPFLLGCTGSIRMAQLLRFDLTIPEHVDGVKDHAYLVATFIPAVRTCLKEGGFTKVEDNREEGGFFLAGYRSQAYHIHDDFQVTAYNDRGGLAAIGCGREYALGAMAALDDECDLPPKERILEALHIAGQFSSGVHGPYYVMSM